MYLQFNAVLAFHFLFPYLKQKKTSLFVKQYILAFRTAIVLHCITGFGFIHFYVAAVNVKERIIYILSVVFFKTKVFYMWLMSQSERVDQPCWYEGAASLLTSV